MKQCNYTLYALFAACLPLTAHAENHPSIDHTETSPWSIVINTSYSQNSYRDTSHLASRSLDLSATVAYQLSEQWSTRVNAGSVRQFDGQEGDYFRNMSWSLHRKNLLTFGEGHAMHAGFRAILPTSELAEKTDFQGALRSDLRFTFDLNFILEGLSATDSLRFQKNFHQYTTVGTSQLTEYTLSNALGLVWKSGSWYISTNLDASKAWTYRGNDYSPEFTHTEELGYEITPNFSTAVGLTNSARYYDPDRGPNPIDTLFDLDKPTYYFSLTYNY